MPTFAVSSWSLDGLLRAGLPLLELPEQLRAHGLSVLELCHFHLPATDPAYLQALRGRLEEAGVELFSILIDAGDIVAPDPAQQSADVAFVKDWIDRAGALGARRVRVDAGRQPPTPEVVRRSAGQLRELAAYAAGHGVAVSTENWHETSLESEPLLQILALCEGRVGLCADTGNAEATADKYATLRQLLPHASSVHLKPRYTPLGAVEQDDLRRCLELLREAAFDGIITLIYDRKQHEWEGLAHIRQAVEDV
jgi:sugar phosphate isomerase/epimerase